MGQQQLHAGQYHFTTIAGGSSPWRFPLIPYNGTPTINNNGIVAFGATQTGGVSGIFSGNGAEVTTLVDTTGQFRTFFYEEISINSAGTVAFQAELDTSVRGIFTVAPGGTITTIADTAGGFTSLGGVSINDAGMVAFYGAGEDSQGLPFDGIYAGQGGPLTTIVESHYSPDDVVGPMKPYYWQPSINNGGEVAFFRDYEGGEGIFIGNGTSLTRIVDTEGAFYRLVPEARCPINDSGAIAFVAETELDDDYPVRGVYVYSDGAITKIADNRDLDPSGSFNDDDLCDVMINNVGAVAFGGVRNYIRDSRGGLYTGRDPDADRVIAYGDSLLGSPVLGVRFWGQGLNDRGQIAFYARTESGTGVYLATPVPEPATSLLILCAVPLVLWRRAATVTPNP